MAGKLEQERADAAISLSRRVIPAIVGETSNSACEEGVRLERRGGDLVQAQERRAQFGDYLAELRVQYKPKRNFIKLLDGVTRCSAGAPSAIQEPVVNT